jgi:CBS domain-containing protein
MQRTIIPVSMDDSVAKVEALFKSNRISSAPVYDEKGAVLGIITSTDLVNFHSRGKDPRQVSAWEICNYQPIKVTSEFPISGVADLMLNRRIHHILVTENDALVGIVSSLDFVKLVADGSIGNKWLTI